jgi:BirA family biotin operon repressor/biotin-[acetyl-CoA-carboxylase] ligase
MPETSGRPTFLIHHLSTVDSTNTYLKKMLQAPEWTVVTADEQTAGRGRHANHWHSSVGDGLYLSVLLRPTAEPGSIPRGMGLLSLLAAVAAAEALEGLGLRGIDIKWPNDLLVEDRKIGGILIETETSASGLLERAILGIGINLNQVEFPPPLDETATSYRLETGKRLELGLVREAFLERLSRWYRRWQEGEFEEIRRCWLASSSYGSGRVVEVTVAGVRVEGVTAGLDSEGGLLLVTSGGEVRTIVTGEVRRLRPFEGGRAK